MPSSMLSTDEVRKPYCYKAVVFPQPRVQRIEHVVE